MKSSRVLGVGNGELITGIMCAGVLARVDSLKLRFAYCS